VQIVGPSFVIIYKDHDHRLRPLYGVEADAATGAGFYGLRMYALVCDPNYVQISERGRDNRSATITFNAPVFAQGQHHSDNPGPDQ